MIDFSTYQPLFTAQDLPSDLAEMSEAQIGEVSETIRGYCLWHIAPSTTDTIYVDHFGRSVLTLPSLHVTEISSVTDVDGTEIVDFEWSVSGQLSRRQGWPRGFRAVKVTFTHGLTAAPSSLVGVGANMLRDRQAEAEGGAVTSAGLDGADVQFANPFAPRGASTAVGVRRDLESAYGHVLNRFRL